MTMIKPCLGIPIGFMKNNLISKMPIPSWKNVDNILPVEIIFVANAVISLSSLICDTPLYPKGIARFYIHDPNA